MSRGGQAHTQDGQAGAPTRRNRVPHDLLGVPDGADQDTHTKQILDASASRARECVQIAPGTKPKLAEVSAIHDVEPTVMVYQSAVRDRHLLITSGQLYIEGPSSGTHAGSRPWCPTPGTPRV